MQIVFSDFLTYSPATKNAPGPAFLKSSDSIVEELFLVFSQLFAVQYGYEWQIRWVTE